MMTVENPESGALERLNATRVKPRRRILLVEDGERLSSLLKTFLESRGYETLVEADGSQATARFLAERPDLVILDLMLPGKDGFQVCKEMRAISNAPILVFTARADDIDHVLGLEIGADDYVVKPLEPRVLLARVEALLRRSEREVKGARSQQVLTVGPFVITRSARSATYRGKPLDLTAADFELFWLLVSNYGNVVEREQLIRLLKLGGSGRVGRALDGRAFRLRKKLEDAGAPATLVKSLRSQGYMLAAEE
jgi:two-component system response regulator RstA